VPRGEISPPCSTPETARFGGPFHLAALQRFRPLRQTRRMWRSGAVRQLVRQVSERLRPLVSRGSDSPVDHIGAHHRPALCRLNAIEASDKGRSRLAGTVPRPRQRRGRQPARNCSSASGANCATTLARARYQHRGRARTSDQLTTGRNGSEPSQPWAPPLTISKKSRNP
jgi:hypothetical protein